jgi:succinate dehydrogenase hydrophobic anchor subunit
MFSINFKNSLRIHCVHCNTLNQVSSKEAKNGGCEKCKLPLNWSISKGTHIPNFIPIAQRITALIMVVALIALSGYAIFNMQIDLPYGSKRHQIIVHYSKSGIILPIISAIFGIVAGISIIIDHIDLRKNEELYKKIYDWSFWSGWAVYFLALFFADGVVRR